MDELLTKAPVDILVHFNLWPEEPEKKNPNHVYAVLPPIFLCKKEYLDLSSLKRRERVPVEGERR